VKDVEKKVKRINKWVEKWRDKLLLNEWSFDVQLMESDKTSDGYRELASITACHVYFKGNIKIYPLFFLSRLKVQEQNLVHELCHCFTQDAWDAMADLHYGKLVTPDSQRIIIERLTERIASVAFLSHW